MSLAFLSHTKPRPVLVGQEGWLGDHPPYEPRRSAGWPLGSLHHASNKVANSWEARERDCERGFPAMGPILSAEYPCKGGSVAVLHGLGNRVASCARRRRKGALEWRLRRGVVSPDIGPGSILGEEGSTGSSEQAKASQLSSSRSSVASLALPTASGSFGPKQHSLYKTELCRSWEETGTCRYGSKCQFAHGMEELREVSRHPKYKTEICCTFATTGTCPYGRRCRFIHQNGPITSVGAKRSDDLAALPKNPLKQNWVAGGKEAIRVGHQGKTTNVAYGTRWPGWKGVQDPMAPASRRLPVFVKLSMATATRA